MVEVRRTVGQPGIIASMAALTMFGAAAFDTQNISGDALRIGSTRQLFLDDYVIDRMQNVVRRLHRPVRYPGNPLIAADKPWEAPAVGSGSGVSLFGGAVIFDEEERLFKMWYRTDRVLPSPPGSATTFVTPPGGYSALYATSRDGLHWEKPALGLVEHNGSRQNNILPAGKGATGFIRRPMIIKDYHDPDPGGRYKMLYMDELGPDNWGLRKALSPDGIRWQMDAGTPIPFRQNEVGAVKGLRANGELFGWDPRRHRYVLYTLSSSGLTPADVDGRQVRHEDAVWELSSPDFENWGEPRELIERDPHADPPQWSPSHVGVMTAILYTDDLYIGFLDTATTYATEDVPAQSWDIYSTEHDEHRSELVMSRDGVHWKRVAPHWWVLPPGLWGTWDHDHVALAKPIVRNDEILIYYSGNNVTCHFHLPGHPQYELAGKVVNGVRLGYAIGLARLRLDGFASLEAYQEGGTITTKPLIFERDRLEMNVRAPHGEVRVEILTSAGQPLPGYRAGECDGFVGDELHHVVTWKGNASVRELAGQAVRLKFYLKNAALYSFQFQGEHPGTLPMNRLCPGCRGRP
jgi:hypothetical protein